MLLDLSTGVLTLQQSSHQRGSHTHSAASLHFPATPLPERQGVGGGHTEHAHGQRGVRKMDYVTMMHIGKQSLKAALKEAVYFTWVFEVKELGSIRMKMFLIISVSKASAGAFHSWTAPLPPCCQPIILLPAVRTQDSTHIPYIKSLRCPSGGLSLHSEPPKPRIMLLSLEQSAQCPVWFGYMTGTKHFSNRLLT